MRYNINSGFGRRLFDAMMQHGPVWGKLYIVAKSGHKNYDKIQELAKSDPDGDIMLYSTIEAAITAANARIDWSGTPWGNQDRILIFPGNYAENLTSLPHGCELIGVSEYDMRDAQAGVKIEPASGSPIDANAWVNGRCENIAFISKTTYRAFDCLTINNVRFKNCFFSGPAETTTATEAFYCNDATYLRFDDCHFCNATIGIRFEYADAGDKAAYVDINNCKVTGCATSGLYISTNLVGPHSVVRNTVMVGAGQTTTKQVDDNSNIFDYVNSWFEGTTAVEGGRSYNGCYGNGVLLT